MSGVIRATAPDRELSKAPIIELDHVSQVFGTKRGAVHAVNDVSLTITQGEVLCLVGESGSGKTTTAKMIAGLRPPTAGQMRYTGTLLTWVRARRTGRGRDRAGGAQADTTTRVAGAAATSSASSVGA